MVSPFYANSHRTRGTTLAELLVVMCTFSLLMTIILSFYIQASRVTKQQDIRTQDYRTITFILDKIEMEVAHARVFSISQSTIVYSPLEEKKPLTTQGPNWVYPPKVLLIDHSSRSLRILQNGAASGSTLCKLPTNIYVTILAEEQTTNPGVIPIRICAAASFDLSALELMQNSEWRYQNSRTILVRNPEVS